MSLSASRHLHRQFTWLQTSAETAEADLCACLRQRPEVEVTLLISDQSRAGFPPIASRQAAEWLGRETDRVILDAFAGFNPNAFAQICGTLKGGGELILLSPEASVWPGYADPEYAALRGSRYQSMVFPGYFLQRLVSQLASPWSPACVPETRFCEPPYLSQQQAHLVEQLVADFSTTALTAVITADRGRGKTASLGLALSQLLTEQPLKVVVTAPSRAAVDALFSALLRQCPDGRFVGSGFDHPRLQVRFYPPAVLLQKSPEADLVIVDEAAAIPVSLLQSIRQLCSRQWFATTLHGYEGNGRGFELRFLSSLSAQVPGWKRYCLTDPVRWASGDPLEALSYRVLLLDAEPPPLPEPDTLPAADVTAAYQSIRVCELLADERLLRQVFGLLIAAHYRTTPNDLRQLLDSPDLQIRVLSWQSQPLAVALLVDEGPVPEALIEPIWGGYRRPGGDLIPQTLLSREGLRSAARLRGWRVMRIAVHPQWQARGLGGQLLTAVADEATELGLDFCGASFAASEALLRFWLRYHYVPLRLGERCDRVTAGWPLLVFRALSESAEQVTLSAQQLFARRLALRLNQPELQQQRAFVQRCLAVLPQPDSLASTDPEALYGFAFQQRSLEDSMLVLRDWLGSAKLMKAVQELSCADQALLMGRVWQLHSAEQVAEASAIQGKQAQLQRLRHLVAELLDVERQMDQEYSEC